MIDLDRKIEIDEKEKKKLNYFSILTRFFILKID